MVAFGDVMIDGLGPIRETPSVSAVGGLLANALGVRREESSRLARLQDRLIVACRVDHVETRFTDFQTAQLDGKDRGWTTSGAIQKRAGAPDTFKSPHIRERDYDSDVSIAIALRMRNSDETPTIDDLTHAIQWPARPLFLGRKCCLPSAPLFDRVVEAETALEALRQLPLRKTYRRQTAFGASVAERVVVTLPPDEACPLGFETVLSTEWRDWPAGIHAGEQRRFRGFVDQTWFVTEESG